MRISEPALNDLAGILDWSASRFGLDARAHYEILIETAFLDLVEDPFRRGSRALPDAVGSERRLFHLKWSRKRSLDRGGGVRSPCHFIAYRWAGDEVVVVLRVLHEAMDIRTLLSENAGDDLI